MWTVRPPPHYNVPPPWPYGTWQPGSPRPGASLCPWCKVPTRKILIKMEGYLLHLVLALPQGGPTPPQSSCSRPAVAAAGCPHSLSCHTPRAGRTRTEEGSELPDGTARTRLPGCHVPYGHGGGTLWCYRGYASSPSLPSSPRVWPMSGGVWTVHPLLHAILWRGSSRCTVHTPSLMGHTWGEEGEDGEEAYPL